MILAVQIDADTVYVALGGIASAVGIANMFTTRAREQDAAADRHREALQHDNDTLRAENQRLRTDLESAYKWKTEAEKWQRRAQDWRRVNGDSPWPD